MQNFNVETTRQEKNSHVRTEYFEMFSKQEDSKNTKKWESIIFVFVKNQVAFECKIIFFVFLTSKFGLESDIYTFCTDNHKIEDIL